MIYPAKKGMPMPIPVQCSNPECGYQSTAPDDYAGRSLRCPRCRTVFRATTTAEFLAADTLETRGGLRSSPGSHGDSLPRLDRFEISKRLGGGAFGEVFLAFDPQLQRQVALKVPRPGVLDSATLVERFLSEGIAAAGLNHPNIVPVFDAGKEGDRYYLASAYVPGRTLADVAGEGKLDFVRAARIVRALAEALDCAHGQGIVHRDVKPANVMVDEQSEPHLMDFGLAHRHEAEQKLTRDGAVLGTPAYMAPEQAAGQTGDPLPASDQYSLGVVLYDLLTGDTPFSGPPPIVLYNVVHKDPEPPRQRKPSIPRDLETVCLKAMAREPGNRYPSCHAFAEDLRRWLEGEPIQARRRTVVERATRWLKRHPLQVGLAAVTVVCLLIVSRMAAAWGEKLREKQSVTAGKQEEARLSEKKALEQKAEADRRKGKADQQRELAERKKREADQKLHEARESEKKQKKETEAILAANREVLEEGKKERRNQLLLKFDQAERLLEQHDAQGALKELCAQIPDPGKDDLRAPRWHVLWKRAFGARGVPLLMHTRGIRRLALRPDGRAVAAVAEDGAVKLWDVPAGTELVALEASAGFKSVSFRPDGRWLAGGGADGTIRLWDVQTGKQVRAFKGHAGTVWSICFSPDGQRVVSGGGDGWVKVWDPATGKEGLTIETAGAVRCVHFSPDGKWIAWGYTDLVGVSKVRVCSAATGQPSHLFQGHEGAVSSVCFSPDSKRLASASHDGKLKVWDVLSPDTGQRPLTLQGHTGIIESVCFSPDGQRLVSGSHDKTVRVWDARTGEEILSLPWHAAEVTDVCFSADGKRLASASLDRTVRVWNAELGRERLTIKGGGVAVHKVSFSPDGKRLAVVRAATVEVWDAQTQQQLFTLNRHGKQVTCVCFSADGKRIASGSGDNTVKVWDAETGKEALSLKGHIGPVYSLVFSPDGKTLASASRYEAVKVWDAQTGKEVLSLKGHIGSVYSLMFSPDGKRLVSGSGGFDGQGRPLPGEVKVWDAQTGQEALSLKGHTNWVSSVAFSPDGQTLIKIYVQRKKNASFFAFSQN